MPYRWSLEIEVDERSQFTSQVETWSRCQDLWDYRDKETYHYCNGTLRWRRLAQLRQKEEKAQRAIRQEDIQINYWRIEVYSLQVYRS